MELTLMVVVTLARLHARISIPVKGPSRDSQVTYLPMTTRGIVHVNSSSLVSL
jgi:hypothetical protein